eukprot:TRINITY_DN3011_c0_g1_i1.p1 TRINITY_DN3011_c0_g1~~TRINITY_DN3011_c0_g1_i1.p1  ORF type:complete len:152 (-),score=53.60 TRINITY_DN3011_c0_g1_i1:142-597(-)
MCIRDRYMGFKDSKIPKMNNELQEPEYWTNERIVGNILSILLTISILLTVINSTLTEKSWALIIMAILVPFMIFLALMPVCHNALALLKNVDRTLAFVCMVGLIVSICLYYLTSILGMYEKTAAATVDIIGHAVMLSVLGFLSYWLTIFNG